MTYNDSSFEVINLGSGRPKPLQDLLEVLQHVMGMRAEVTWAPLPLGDVPQTAANVNKAVKLLGYDPKTSFEAGLTQFYRWFVSAEQLAKRAALAT